MLSFEKVQAEIMSALDQGPAHLPEGLFRGERARALLGMKIHANTISHARLVALEDTFPRTRSRLGTEAFNKLSRMYLDWPGVLGHPLALIGADFAAFLRAGGETLAEADLAAFEWAWLASYHAAEAPTLGLADLAGIAEAVLLEIVLERHPAAQLLCLNRLVHQIIGEEVPGLGDAPAILLTRPHAQVLVAPATTAMSAVFAQASTPVRICNLFGEGAEPEGEHQLPPDDIMNALIALMESGALQRAG